MLTDLKLSKAWISKIIQSRGFLRLINESSSSFGKNVLAPSGITAAASANDLGLQKKIHGSGTTTLIISNDKMNDIMKIVQFLEDSNILLKGVTETIKNETKEQKGGFLGMLLGTLGASLLGNMLAGKWTVKAAHGKGIVKAGYGSKMDF